MSSCSRGPRPSGVFYVPGEHDVFIDDGQEFLKRFGQGTSGGGWRSFDYQGVHFVGLVNVLNFKDEAASASSAPSSSTGSRDLAGLDEQHAGGRLHATSPLGGLPRPGAGSPRTASRRCRTCSASGPSRC